MLKLFGDKAAKPFVRSARVYLPLEGDAALVASVDDHGGLRREREGGVERLAPVDPQSLGAAVKRKLAECEARDEVPNLAGTKKSDWPAYRASGSKTLKAFEHDFIPFSVEGANEANITWQVLSPELPNGVMLTAMIGAFESDEATGRWLRDFHAFFLRVRASLSGA